MDRRGVLSAGSVVVIVALALTHLRSPFWGDQALYTLGAESLDRGAHLYRDFWDLKQPGIYYFFLVAGRAFGFGEFGVHLLEALYQSAFAVALLIGCQPLFRTSAVAAVPLLTIGAYYALADPPALTSVEALAGFPLVLCMTFAARAATAARFRRGSGRMRVSSALAAGVFGAIVVTFKLAFAPIIAAFGCAASAVLFRRGQRRAAAIVAAAGLLGLIVPLLALFAAYAAGGTLGAALTTWFLDPGRITRVLPRLNVRYELVTFVHFLRITGPLIVLAAVGVWSRRRRLDVLESLLLLWLVVGLGVAVAQVWSWNYRFFIVIVPLGILAATGIETIAEGLAERASVPLRVLAVAAVLVVCAPLIAGAVQTSTAPLPMRVPLIAHWQSGWSRKLFAAYSDERRETRFLTAPGSLRGAIYVVGDPRYYFLAGRGQAIAINGWSPQLLLPEQWQAIATQLDARRPPYIFIAADRDALLARAPALRALLERAYRDLRHDPAGIWYERRDGRASSLSSGSVAARRSSWPVSAPAKA